VSGGELMENSTKSELITWMKRAGAFDVRVADPTRGFDRVPDEVKPLSLWPQCRSVVVFAVAMSPDCNNIFLGPIAPLASSRNLGPVPENIQSEEYALNRLARLFLSSITLKGMLWLTHYDHAVSFRTTPLKVAACESGLGVYGRSGLILHPILGNRMSLGVILTDAILEPDPKLADFKPCADCYLCIKNCPAGAYDPKVRYPEGWCYDTCTAKRKEISDEGYYCHNCFAVCPAGKLSDRELLRIRNAVSISPEHNFNL